LGVIFIFGHNHKGRAVHYIFSFPKEGKEKDAISIAYAGVGLRRDFLGVFRFVICNKIWIIFVNKTNKCLKKIRTLEP